MAPSGAHMRVTEVKIRVRARKARPSRRKRGIEVHRLLIKIDGFPQGIDQKAACAKSQSAQIGIVSLWIVCRFNCQRLLFASGELCLQRLRDSFCDLALDAKDVSQLSIVGLG